MVEWNNFVMQKYGGPIRGKIYEAMVDFQRAVISTAINKAAIRAEKERLKDLPDIKDIKDEDFFKGN